MVAHLISPFSKAHALLRGAGFTLCSRKIYFWDAAFSEKKSKELAQLTDDEFTPVASEYGHLMGWHRLEAARREADAQRLTFESFLYLEHSFQPLVNALIKRFSRLGGRELCERNVIAVDLTEDGALVDLAATAIFMRTGHHYRGPGG